MTIQIENILIWQKNGDLRNLPLKTNAVNVITGESGKGKSSILHIIDYCLLSSKADGISKANIDSKSDWYGLVVKTSKGSITIARPAFHVGENRTVYLSDKGDVPALPKGNMKVDSLKKLLDKEFGLDSDLRVPYGGQTIKAGSKVSFRNFLSYCYQDQGAIVAPEYLYNKPSDLKVIERIERTFRMALGIVDTKGALAVEKLKKLGAEQVSLERRSELMAKKQLEFQEDLTELEDEAISLGLLDRISDDHTASLAALEEIANSPIDRFDSVGEQLKELDLRQHELNRKLRQYKKFNEGYRDYQALIKESDDAIRPVEYLFQRYEEVLPGTKTGEVLYALERELNSVKSSWKKRNESLLLVDVNEQVRVLEEELTALKPRLSDLTNVAQNLSSPREVYRYQGKLGVKVELFSDKVSSIDYTAKISDVKAEIRKLEGIVQDMESKREFVMGKLNEKVNLHLENLKLKGYESSQAVFLEKDRVINLILDGGKSVEKMIDIGSASNYLYIHLSYFMALHEVARDRNVPWMPRFLVFDQVSTPYTLEDEDDRSCLNAALREIDNFIEDMKSVGGFQVILLEHIPESHWVELGLDNFKLVDKELRGDYGLIN